MLNWVGSLFGGKKSFDDWIAAAAAACKDDKLDEAEKALRKALEIAEEEKPLNYDQIAKANYELGVLLDRQEKGALAETHYRKAFQTWEESEVSVEAGIALLALANLYFKQHRLAEAQQLFHHSRTFFGDTDVRLGHALVRSGECSAEQGEFKEAENLYRRGTEILEKQADKVTAVEFGGAYHKLGLACAGQAQAAEAKKNFDCALKHFEKNVDSHNKEEALRFCSFLHDFARYQVEQKQYRESEALIARAEKISAEYPGYLLEAELLDDRKKIAGLNQSQTTA